MKGCIYNYSVINICEAWGNYMNTKTRDKFVALAETRVTKAIKSIRLVGNLSNRNNYKYTKEDAQKIIKALENEVRAVKQRFDSGEAQSDIEFKL